MLKLLPVFFISSVLAFGAAWSSALAKDAAVKQGKSNLATKPSKKKSPVKKKTYDYAKSQYKSREPAQITHYKFNKKGEPIVSGAKKPFVKNKKRSGPAQNKAQKEAATCDFGESCPAQKTEADAL